MWQWCRVFSCCLALLVSGQVNADIRTQQTSNSSPVQLEKAYQQVLYEYYQGNFALALSKMALLEQQFPGGLTQIPDSLRGHQVEPELLKGGMSLAYGLDNQAMDIFQRLLNHNTAPDVTAYAWLLLGKTYYQKRQFSAAARTLQQISQENAGEFFDPTTRDNWLYMQSQLHGFLLGQESGAADVQWLEQLSVDSIYRDYVQYNQALALLQNGQNGQNGQKEQAINLLSTLANNNSSFVSRWMGWADPIFSADQQSVDAERDAIRDRANLTLGYTLLQNNEPHQAFKIFENIRTEGLDAEAALLGYGWAAAKKHDLQTALAIWLRLMQMPQNSEYTLEAYLASAYAYEKAFAPWQSLQVLQLAVQRFEQALLDLSQAEQQVKQRQFILDILANTETNTETNTEANTAKPQMVDDTMNLSLKSKGRQFNVIELFDSVAVSSEFEAGISALAQSFELLQQLQNWQQRLQQYHLMLDERQAVRRKRAKHILQNRTLEQLTKLQVRRDALALVIDTAKQQQEGQVFMSLESQDWLSRVQRSGKRIATIDKVKKQLGQPPLAESYSQRLARVAGRLMWQASEAYSANQWQAQKQLNQLDSEIVKAHQRQQQLLIQLAAKPDFAEQRRRVSALAQRINIEVVKNEGLQALLIDQLSDIFKQFIQAHKKKVSDYILQAQLAIVRLNDQALQQDKDSSTPFDETSANAGDAL